MVLNKKQSGLSGRREVEDNGTDISPFDELQIHIQLDQLPQQGNGNAVDARVDARVDDSAKVTTPLNTEPAQARKTNHMVGLSKKSPILQPKTGEEAVYGKTSGTWKAEEAFTKIQSEDGESQGHPHPGKARQVAHVHGNDDASGLQDTRGNCAWKEISGAGS